MPLKILNEELNRLDVPAFKAAKKNPIIILLDNIRSRNNVGSVFRTADAFLIEKIILGGICPAPPHRDIYKTALGATESVNWEHSNDIMLAIKNAKDQGYKLLAVEQVKGAISLEEFNYKQNEKVILVFGSEVGGVQQEIIDLADACIEIPQFGTKHSLNISVSVGVVLWQLMGGIIKT